MKRYVCWLALLGVGAVPDWASAFGRRYWCGPAYYEPLYFAPPPVYYAPPPCAPVYVAVPCPPASTPAPPQKTPTARTPKPADPPKPMPETVRPAGGVSPAAPRSPAPRDDIDFRPASPPAAPPKVEVPKIDTPKIDTPKIEPRSPGLEIPPVPAAAPGGLTLPPVAPDANIPLIPSPVPPLSPEPKKTETLPPLVLPPESPVKPSTSRSSPLGKLTVNVYAASGNARTSDGLKKVVFFNHTARDLNLTIEGKAVTLPAKSYVNARLGASFRWKHGDNDAETATIPADAAGLDVVFKE